MFLFFTFLFIVVSVAMILIILVQRAQGGGLAGAFGGAGGAGTDTVFGGRVGDALTWATIIAFVLYLLFAVLLNRIEINPPPAAAVPPPAMQPAEGTPAEGGAGGTLPPVTGDAPTTSDTPAPGDG